VRLINKNMNTLRLTKKDFKDTDNYWKEYIGKADVSNYDGNIEIEVNLGYVRFAGNLKATGSIIADAGSGIKAGWGIEAGLSITCKLEISWSYKMFAGICYWKNSNDSEKTITCGKLEPKDGATVEYGIVKELGMPDESKPSLSGKIVKVELDGVSYEAIIQ
jgi:hypothetical protein